MGGPSKEHEALVDKLIAEGATKDRFRGRVAMWLTDPNHPRLHNWEPSFQSRLRRQALEYRAQDIPLEELYSVDHETPMAEVWLSHYEGLGPQKNPDAFRFDGDVLTVFEVVKTSDLDPAEYNNLWTYIEANDFGFFQLKVISHHGGATHTYRDEEFFPLVYSQAKQ
jgi:hypothetical protein